MFADLEAFKENISWFFNPGDEVAAAHSSLSLSDGFKTAFPVLFKLVNTARVLAISINGEPYRLLSWDDVNNTACGWLCKIEPAAYTGLGILPEHRLLLDNIGGIIESYNQPDGALTNNQNFLFLQSECHSGLDEGLTGYYRDVCQEEQATPLPDDNLIAFVNEANGAETLYDKVLNKVYLFSPDHCFDDVTVLEGQPPYTYHLINGVTTFTNYVEMLATQWLAHVNP